jgi:type II secretory pathway pseudopilin PulG
MASQSTTRRKLGAAFTLVELLLTVSLILLLAGTVIFNFGQFYRNSRLEEGTTQLETLVRFARAQAANTGRRVKIVFDQPMLPQQMPGSLTNLAQTPSVALTNQTLASAGTNLAVQALWEPQPIDCPGQFIPLPGAELLVEHVNELVQVLLARQPGAQDSQASGPLLGSTLLELETATTNSLAATRPAPASMPPLYCYPDGASDSVELVLAAADHEDKRLMIVSLSGLSGALRHQMVSFAEDGTVVTNTTSSSNVFSALDEQDQ